MTLRDKAIAAHNTAQERKAHEEAERQAQAKRAHEENLRTLCNQVLDIDATRLPLRYVGGYCWPFIEVDGLLFTCPPGKNELELLIMSEGAVRQTARLGITSVESLGQILSREPILARIEGDHIEGDHIVLAE